MKLNLGCGPDYRDGWFNVDADENVRADLHAKVTHYKRLDDAVGARAVELIYMKHVLEHLPMESVPLHLTWCFKRLASGGEFIVDGPDLRAMCVKLAITPTWTWDDVAMIYGGQLTPWDFHQAGWGHDMLARLFTEAGFTNVRVQRADLCSIVAGTKP